MKKNQLIVLTMSLLMSGSVFATDLVTVTSASGESTGYDVDAITKIAFDSSALKIVASDSEGTTYAIDEIKVIKFGKGSPSAVEGLKTDKVSKITVYVPRDGNSLIVNGWEGVDATRLDIYGTNGALLQRNDKWRGEQVDISALPSGIYVVRIGNKTAKIKK